jgi:hypothetical protein
VKFDPDTGKGPLKGHGLIAEGAALVDTPLLGFQIVPHRRGAGRGRAACSCGALSPELATTHARQDWHRSHKREMWDDLGAPGWEGRLHLL